MRFKIVLLFSFISSCLFVVSQKLSIGYIYPAGGEKGTTFEIQVGGLNISDATEVLISGNGLKAELIPLSTSTNGAKVKKKVKFDDQSSPQLADRVNVRVTIDKNALPGLRDLRLQSKNGISNKLGFEVGQYPNIVEKNISTFQNPNYVNTLPATLCGQIMPGERDYFTFKATKGMKLVAEVKARELVPYIADAVPGWFQPIIRITNSACKEIAYNDDYRNSVDPVIITTIPETDTYTLCIFDAIYRGREDFNYRIQLGEIPFVKYIYPSVGKIGKNTKLKVYGVNIESNNITFKTKKLGVSSFVAKDDKGYISNSFLFYGIPKTGNIDFNSIENKELFIGSIVCDSLHTAFQTKRYLINAIKNEYIAIDMKARRLGSLFDGKMTLKNTSGKILMQNDDLEDPTEGLMTYHADPRIQYKATETGVYILEIEDVLGNFGTEYLYLIERVEIFPTYKVFVSPANLTIPKGGTALIKLDIETTEKFTPEIDFTLKGLPKNFNISNNKMLQGLKTWDMSITAPENAKEANYSIDVEASSFLKGKQQISMKQKAIAADNMMQAFYYMHHIPASELAAKVSQSAPFSLHLTPQMERSLDKSIFVNPEDTLIDIIVRVERRNGFSEPINVGLNKKNKNIVMENVKFLVGETEKTIRLKLNAENTRKIKKIKIPLCFVGTVNEQVDKKGKRSFENASYKEYSPVFVLEKRE